MRRAFQPSLEAPKVIGLPNNSPAIDSIAGLLFGSGVTF